MCVGDKSGLGFSSLQAHLLNGSVSQEPYLLIPLPGSPQGTTPSVDHGQNNGGRWEGSCELTSLAVWRVATSALQVGKPGWNLETGPLRSPCPAPPSSSNTALFKSNVAWKSLLQQLPLKPIVSSAPLTCQILAAADGANTPRRAAIQFKITSLHRQPRSRPISRFHQIQESLRAQFDHAAS